MPGPLSACFHHLPKALHRVEVLANHTAQLVVPWFLFAPEPLSTIAAVIIVVTQGYLMISGNFSWLNFLTIALGALGDRRLGARPRCCRSTRRPTSAPTPDVADRAHRRAGGVRRASAASRSWPTCCRRTSG